MTAANNELSPDAVTLFEIVADRGEVAPGSVPGTRSMSRPAVDMAVGELVRAGLVRVVRGPTGSLLVRLSSRAALQGMLDNSTSPPVASVKLIRARQSLDRVLTREDPAGGGVETLTDLDELHARIQRIADETKRELLSLHAGTLPSAEMLELSLPADLELLDRGVSLWTACPKSFAEHEHIRDYTAALCAHGAEIRFADALPHRLLVADRLTAVVPVDSSHLNRGAKIVTEPLLSASLRHLAVRIFRSGVPLERIDPTAEVGPSPTERRVLLLMNSGVTDEVAARQLSITDRQFRRYVSTVCHRLGATSRFQAGAKAVERGWL